MVTWQAVLRDAVLITFRYWKERAIFKKAGLERTRTTERRKTFTGQFVSCVFSFSLASGA